MQNHLPKLYTALFYALIPFILLRLLWRSLKSPDYRQRINERFAHYKQTYKTGGIWLHTVSVGELMAARPLIEKIQTIYPEKPLTITTTTPTASRQLKKIYGDKVQHVYTPYDTPRFVQAFINTFKPSLTIIMETEIWPNIFKTLQKNQIPFCMVNARLSERSAKNYGYLKKFFAPLLSSVNIISAQSAADKNRFISLGVKPEAVTVMGNLKFDVQVDRAQVKAAKKLRSDWRDRFVWIAASTHTAEEAAIVAAARQVKDQVPGSLCIIAPRHPERFQAVAQQCRQDFTVAQYSLHDKVNQATDVLVADTLGQLMLFYALADVAVVCGSFAPIGGHNILEPAAIAKPVIVGPHMHHFKTILADFHAEQAIIQLPDAQGLAEKLAALAAQVELREALGERAKACVNAQKGAIDKVWSDLQPILPGAK